MINKMAYYGMESTCIFFSLSFDIKNCVQLISTVYLHKVICRFVKAGQIREIPTWTGCVAFPLSQKPWAKQCKVKDNMH